MRPTKKNNQDKTADDWLRHYLTPNEQPANDVIDDAVAAGFSERTIRRSKTNIGAGSAQRGRVWYWFLTVSAPKIEVPLSQPKLDEYGYSTEIPRVPITVNWLEVLRKIKQYREYGMHHTDITALIMGLAYPNAGMSESTIVNTLRLNGINVPNKVLDNTNQL